MEALLSYFLGVNLLLILLVVYYRIFLARERRFQWNRIFLLAGIGAALLLPLLRLDIVPASMPNPSFIRTLPEAFLGSSTPEAEWVPAGNPGIGSTTLTEQGLAIRRIVTGTADDVRPLDPRGAGAPLTTATDDAVQAAATERPTTFGTGLAIALLLYAAGVAMALALFVWRNLSLLRLVRRSTRIRKDGYTLLHSAQSFGPASYFHYVFWPEDNGLDAQSTAVALAHERCHSRQWHSLDLIAVELVKAFCWINPAIYLLRRDLRQTHEFLADQAALSVAGPDGIKQLLLARQLGGRSFTLANPFYSHIKSRITMLAQTPRKRSALNYLLALPLAGLMAACTSFAHPQEQSTAHTAGDSLKADYQPLIDLEEVFLDAEVSILPRHNDPNAGLVCLGAEPPVLDLHNDKPSNPPAPMPEDAPKMLNGDKVVQAMGWPKEAQDQGIEGKVVVKVLVDETGHVIRCLYLEENHPLLRDAVAAHVQELRFVPGKENGKLAKWWVIVPFWIGKGGC